MLFQAALLASLLSTLADARVVTRHLARPSLFPMAGQATWVYQAHTPGGERQELRVVASFQEEHRAFLVQGYFSPEPRWVRPTATGEVWEVSPFSGETFLWYRFAVPEGTRWQIHLAPLPFLIPDTTPCVDGSWLTLASHGERLQVPAGEFVTTKVSWESPCRDAGIVAEWFAPGVGLVRREETSIAGPVVSELVRFSIEPEPHLGGWAVSLSLASPVVWENRMPGTQPSAPAQLRGVFSLANLSPEPVELGFSGCVKLKLRVYDLQAHLVSEGEATGEGCCLCTVILTKELGPGFVAVPFSLPLVDAQGQPLAPGGYAVEGELPVLSPENWVFKAQTMFTLKPVH